MEQGSNFLPQVRAQYEELPYPERNPIHENKRLKMPLFDGLDRINHICHAGLKDFTRNSRILIAGGGTGDSTIFLSEQLKYADCEIVYLDMSKASLEVTKERANIRGLDNITWVNDSILNIPSLDLGKFDHISCTGVLHHLEDPDEGLGILESVLADDGSILVMVYGRYGRTVVYQLQELLRLINQSETDSSAKIRNCRSVMESLHNKHWFQVVKQEYINQRDIELYDLLLHSQDRSYTIPELYDFIEGADLKIARLLYEGQGMGGFLYEPRMYLRDEQMLQSIDKMPRKEQHAIAEILNGRIGKHSLYATREVRMPPGPDMLEFIPSLPLTTTTTEQDYHKVYQATKEPGDLVVINVSTFNTNIVAKKSPNIDKFFYYMNGKRPLQEIYDLIITDQSGALNYDMLSAEFAPLFAAMSKCDYLLMRHKSVPAYRTAEEIQRAMMMS